MHRRRFMPGVDALEVREMPSAAVMRLVASDPTVPRPPTSPPVNPMPLPEPSPGPFPGPKPPIVYPPVPLGGPVGPA